MRPHLHQLVLSFAALIFLSAVAPTRAQAPAPLTSSEFARATSELFTTQVEAARAAQTKSKDPAVKDLASRIAGDYEQAGRALSKICEDLNIDLLPQPRTGQAAAGAAGMAPDSAFDRVYTLELSQHLAKAETSFDSAIRSPKVDPKLKEFARQQLEATRKYRNLAAPLARSQAEQGNR